MKKRLFLLPLFSFLRLQAAGFTCWGEDTRRNQRISFTSETWEVLSSTGLGGLFSRQVYVINMTQPQHLSVFIWHSQKKSDPPWGQLALPWVRRQCWGAASHGLEVAAGERQLPCCIWCCSMLSAPLFLLLGLLGDSKEGGADAFFHLSRVFATREWQKCRTGPRRQVAERWWL